MRGAVTILDITLRLRINKRAGFYTGEEDKIWSTPFRETCEGEGVLHSFASSNFFTTIFCFFDLWID
jgi:hypothetical protein